MWGWFSLGIFIVFIYWLGVVLEKFGFVMNIRIYLNVFVN